MIRNRLVPLGGSRLGEPVLPRAVTPATVTSGGVEPAISDSERATKNPYLKNAMKRMHEATLLFRQACAAHESGDPQTEAELYSLFRRKLDRARDMYEQGTRNAEWTVDEILAREG